MRIIRLLLVLFVTAGVAAAQNTVTFDNQSGEPALVKLSGPTTAAKGSVVLSGLNPKGDTVIWADGSIWKAITVKSVKAINEGGKQEYRMELTDVPKGLSDAARSDFKSVALRSNEIEHPNPEKVVTLQMLRDLKESPLKLPDLAQAEKGLDVVACKWLPEWDRRSVQPEQSAKAEMNGKILYAQFGIDVQFLALKDGVLYALVRNSTRVSGVFDAWCSGLELVSFTRPKSGGQ